MNKKIFAGLLAAGALGLAFYEYKKLTEEEKEAFLTTLKEKAGQLFNLYAPDELKSFLNNRV